MSYSEIASDESIRKMIAALKANGIEAEVVETGADAKERVLKMIPEGAEVMAMTSLTLDAIGVSEEIANSGRYHPARIKLNDALVNPREKKRLGSAPEWAVGSVHAVTEDGHILVASSTGSQLPAYAYGADHVIFVAGAQKIVADFNDGLKRIYGYILPLESERAQKAYGVAGSAVNKLLIINSEVMPGRLHLILVKETLGF